MELAHELGPHLEAVAPSWVAVMPGSYVGDRHDRFRHRSPWTDQIKATVEVLEQLTPRLKDLGIRLAIETHADLTGDELIVDARPARARGRRRDA